MTHDRDHILKLLKLAARATNDGEAANAFAKFRESLRKSDIDIHDLIEGVGKKPRSPAIWDDDWHRDPKRCAKQWQENRERADNYLKNRHDLLLPPERNRLKEIRNKNRPMPDSSGVWSDHYFLEDLAGFFSRIMNLEYYDEWRERRTADSVARAEREAIAKARAQERADAWRAEREADAKRRANETASPEPETVSPEPETVSFKPEASPKAGWGGKRAGAGGPRNAEIAAIMRAQGVARATAYRRWQAEGKQTKAS
jgi:hypothetical protein